MRTIAAELVTDAKAELGEGPAWDAAAGRLIWVDIMASTVHELVPGGPSRSWHVGEHVGAVVPRARGGLLLAVASGFAVLADDGSVSPLAGVAADDPLTRMNDAKCDPQGRLWAGTMAYAKTPGAGSLYRLDPDGTVHRVLARVTISNGLGWSPDGTQMYYTDTAEHGVDVLRFDGATGAVSGRRRLITVDRADGNPDGMCTDDEGFLWVALWGGSAVRRYRPDGVLDTVVTVPASQVTSCAFGGPDRGDLYITTAAGELSAQQRDEQPLAGGLFRARPGVTGPPATPFAG